MDLCYDIGSVVFCQDTLTYAIFFFFGETKGASWDCKTTHSLLMKDTNFLELHASMQFSFFSGYKM